MSRLALVASVALAVAGCSVAAEEDAATNTADLVAPVWTTDQAQTNVSFVVYGSGDVPAGAACTPGFANVYLNDARSEVSVGECIGSPLRMRYRAIPLDGEQLTALVVAARGVAFSEKTTCAETNDAPYILMSVYPKTTGAFPGQTVRSDRFACEGGLKTVSGLERVQDVLDEISAANPPEAPAVYVGGAPPAPGQPIWNARSTTISLTIGGEGFTPPGSTCALGSSRLTYIEREDGSALIGGVRCTARDDSGRLEERGVYVALDAAEKAKVRAVLPRLYTASVARCTPGARYLSVVVNGKDDAGATTTASFTGDENACVLGVDRSFVDLEPLRAVLEEVAQ